VTNAAVVERLRALGVDYAQGNWISPPRPLAGAVAADGRAAVAPAGSAEDVA
jgi:EAL domain-containing protein (putative c-di-GMP-specific phosphodiesterase class I)